jgi:hypothetical protein
VAGTAQVNFRSKFVIRLFSLAALQTAYRRGRV